MDINCERPDVAETIPDRAAAGQVDRLEFNSQAQPVKVMALRYVSVRRPQTARYLLFLRDQLAFELWQLRTDCVEIKESSRASA